MQSEISPAWRPVGHSAKYLCEIGLTDLKGAIIEHIRKTSDVGLLGGVGEWESSAWPSERPVAVLLGFWAAFEATLWGSRWGAEPLALAARPV